MEREDREEMDAPLPDGWIEDLHAKADLVRSFALLRGCRHFYAEAWRGRIRSEQLRFDAARKYFDKALSKLDDSMQEDVAFDLQAVALKLWCLENTIAETGDVPPDTEENLGVDPCDDPPKEALEPYPEVLRTVCHRRYSVGLFRMHTAEYSLALEAFDELMEYSPDDEHLPMAHLGTAACLHNLGMEDERDKAMETAAQLVRSTAIPLLQARGAGTLWSFKTYLRREHEAEDWRKFLDALPCPQPTKDVFLRRGELMLERSRERKTLLLL